MIGQPVLCPGLFVLPLQAVVIPLQSHNVPLACCALICSPVCRLVPDASIGHPHEPCTCRYQANNSEPARETVILESFTLRSYEIQLAAHHLVNLWVEVNMRIVASM